MISVTTAAVGATIGYFAEFNEFWQKFRINIVTSDTSYLVIDIVPDEVVKKVSVSTIAIAWTNH